MTDDLKIIGDQVAARIEQEAAELAAMDPEKLDPRFVRQCLQNNERGDGILFAKMQRDRLVYNKSTQQWLLFNGQHWEIDKLDIALRTVEQVAIAYLDQADTWDELIGEAKEKKADAEAAESSASKDDQKTQTEEKAKAKDHGQQVSALIKSQKSDQRRADRLRTVRGAGNCLTWSHCCEESLAAVSEDFDTKPMLLPCANGVIDLKTGELKPGRPDDYLLKAIPIEYEPNAEAPDVIAFIEDIMLGDQDMVDFLQRLFGYTLTGLTVEHFIGVFIGEGRNGKGTLFELLHHILGPLAWRISPELILDSKNARSSAGASPDLVSLQGSRMVVAAETDENRRISASRIKELTGGDTIKARGLYDRFEINFRPTHKLFLQTNHIPVGLTKDFALLQRLLYIHFPLMYVDDPDEAARANPTKAEFYRKKDKDLPQRLMQQQQGFLTWLVQGCLKWQKEGLNPPDKIKADIEALRKEEDYIGQFIDDCCRPCDSRTQFKQIYKVFEKWFAEHRDDRDGKVPSKKWISEHLVKKGYQKENIGGQIHIHKLEIKPDTLFDA